MYVCDFETTTSAADCRVWAWGAFEIGSYDNFTYGNSIESFFKWLKEIAVNKETIYFHNLKFDAQFILYYLLKNGWTAQPHSVSKKDYKSFDFTTLISDKGQFYSLELYFKKLKTVTHKVKILDSLKVLPFKVEELPKAFNIALQKLEIDYNEDRPIGHELTQTEIEYLKNDCVIVSRALDYLFASGLTKMTTAGNAFAAYKDIIGKANFTRWFPTPDYDADIRQAYRGGFTFVNPKFQNVECDGGIVLDVNSLYPSVMRYKPLPFGIPNFHFGKVEPTTLYPLYVQMLRCNFKLKEGYLPTIQLKNNGLFSPTEYITDSNGEDVVLCLTNIDLDLFFEHYEVTNIEYMCGYSFKQSYILFADYVDKWNTEKIKSAIEGNSAKRTLAKLLLNSLYGRFAINPNCRSFLPRLDPANDDLCYTLDDPEERELVYIPVAIFITSWARDITIRAAQANIERFYYADTDSLHLRGYDLPNNIEIDDYKLGAWKLESKFVKAKYLRAKSYIEVEESGKLKITCAGLPAYCHSQVTFENFQKGASYGGKLRPVKVPGGVILEECNFTIN